jgi:DedD protein
VLESRHLVGLFLGVVVICSVFFTLGYVMGHNQYGGAVQAAETAWRRIPSVHAPEKPSETQPSAALAPTNSEWDFYAKKDNERPGPAGKPPVPAIAPVPAVGVTPSAVASSRSARAIPASARFQPPKVGKGAVVLQVAALRHESDALAMADALQLKKFPSFVVTSAADSFYRVQVGPYPDERSVEAAKTALEHAGFKAIVRR